MCHTNVVKRFARFDRRRQNSSSQEKTLWGLARQNRVIGQVFQRLANSEAAALTFPLGGSHRRIEIVFPTSVELESVEWRGRDRHLKAVRAESHSH